LWSSRFEESSYATHTNQHQTRASSYQTVQSSYTLRSVYLASGQAALDPTSGELVGDDIQAQTHRTLQNLQAVLTSAGTSLANVVKTTVFLIRMSDFQAMNAVYATYFSNVPPARSTVAVAELPKQALVEIECIAFVEE